jgi:hypothetical protein
MRESVVHEHVGTEMWCHAAETISRCQPSEQAMLTGEGPFLRHVIRSQKSFFLSNGQLLL